jgi:hypothetical protein
MVSSLLLLWDSEAQRHFCTRKRPVLTARACHFAFNRFPCGNRKTAAKAKSPCFQRLPYSNRKLLCSIRAGVTCHPESSRHRRLFGWFRMLPGNLLIPRRGQVTISDSGASPSGNICLRLEKLEAPCSPSGFPP